MDDKILILYLILPFVFALVTMFMNNVVHIRRLSKFLLSLFLGITFLGYSITEFSELSISNCSFIFSKNTFLIAIAVNFAFLIFAFLSKFLLFKRQKAYYLAQFLILAFLNLFLFSDNIFILFLALFWLGFIFYILEFNFSKKAKKVLNAKLTLDFGILVIAFCLIAFGFLRYFLLNNIEFSFSNVFENVALVEPASVLAAFAAFNIIVLALLRLLPFNFKGIKTLNPLCSSLNSIVSMVLGLALFGKAFICFNDFYLRYQDLIIIYLILNIVYFSILIFKQKSFLKFLNLALKILSIMAILFLFNDSEEILPLFLYCIIAFVLLSTLLYSIYLILFSKFRKDIIEKLPSINFNLNRSFNFFFLFSMLNLAFVPGLVLFNIAFYYFKDVFLNLMQFDSIVSNFVPYVILFALFVLSVSSYDLIYRILIEEKQNCFNSPILSKSTKTLLFILLIVALLSALSIKYMTYQLTEGLYISDFNTGY